MKTSCVRSVWPIVFLWAGSVAVSLAATGPALSLERTGSNVLFIHFAGKLLRAAQVQGPYRALPGATSPLATTADGVQEFWRAFLPGVSTFSAGGRFTAALDLNQNLWTWGENYSGQLGNGTLSMGTNTPQLIQPAMTWQTVSAGGGHMAATHTDGTLWTWGSNDYGQLGDGTNTRTNMPHPILTNMIWQAVSAGGSHNLALRSDGMLWTWGINGQGQLGDGMFMTRNVPQPIETNEAWLAVAAGDYHSAALRSDGTLWTWGLNNYGQLGNGTFETANTPQPVGSNQTWQAVAVRGFHTVALRSDGSLWTWGRNREGQLGNGTLVRGTNTPQPILTNDTWQSVAAGLGHTLALRSDGTLWGWGYNDAGQLGNGTMTTTNKPQLALTNAMGFALVAGEYHSVALGPDGTLRTWGFNDRGQLGNGSLTNVSIPQALSSGPVWKPSP